MRFAQFAGIILAVREIAFTREPHSVLPSSAMTPSIIPTSNE
jgi:hypothetical protein